MWLNVVLIRGVAYPEERSGTGPSACCGYCCLLCPTGCPQQRYAKGEKPGVQDYGGRHVAKRSFDSRVAYPEVKVQVRDLVRVMVLLPPLSMGACIRGKFVLSSPRG